MSFQPFSIHKKLNNPSRFHFEPVSCYLCGETSSEKHLIGVDDLTGKEGEFLYVRCSKCSLVYQNPRLPVEEIKEFYDNEYIAHRKKKNWGLLTPLYERAMSKHDREKEKIVKRFFSLNKETQVLDVGCAVGTFLLHLHKKYQCGIHGVDFKEGLEYPDFDKIIFYQGLFYEQQMSSDQFDLITMWHFLEHCYDPNKSLEMARRVLKPEGKLIVEVPRLDSFSYRLFGANWPGVQAPQHTALYSKDTICKLIEKQGFTIEAHLPYGAFPPYFYLFTGTYFKLFGKGLNLDRIIFPYFTGQFLMSPLLLFQKQLNLSMQTVVCRKK